MAVAEKSYLIVFAESGVVGHDKIAYALHDAVPAAQQICDEPLSWATVVHFGPWHIMECSREFKNDC